MGLDREIPAYMYVIGTGKNKLEVKAGARIVRWENKLREKEEDSLEKVCWSKGEKEGRHKEREQRGRQKKFYGKNRLIRERVDKQNKRRNGRGVKNTLKDV